MKTAEQKKQDKATEVPTPKAKPGPKPGQVRKPRELDATARLAQALRKEQTALGTVRKAKAALEAVQQEIKDLWDERTKAAEEATK